MPSGFAVEGAASVEVVAAWTVPRTVVSAVAAAPGWMAIGEYYLPKSCTARLDVVGLVASAGLTLTTRLWDTTDKLPINGSVAISAVATPTRSLGEAVQLLGDRTYQVQVQCVGAAGDDKFGVVLAATISD